MARRTLSFLLLQFDFGRGRPLVLYGRLQEKACKLYTGRVTQHVLTFHASKCVLFQSVRKTREAQPTSRFHSQEQGVPRTCQSSLIEQRKYLKLARSPCGHNDRKKEHSWHMRLAFVSYLMCARGVSLYSA